jgi:hypothetical protein
MSNRREDDSVKKGAVLNELRKLSSHKYVKLTNRGNSAIFSALYIAKKVNFRPYVLIPDQGGWITYETFPAILGFQVKKIKTNDGIIDLDDLKENVKTGSAFIFSTYAGYFAKQDVKEISKICRAAKCLVIEDITAALGDTELCNSADVDVRLSSFGRWKPINLGHGGFVSCNDKDWLENTSDIFKMVTPENLDYDTLLTKLDGLKERREMFLSRCEKVKKDLDEMDIMHRYSIGINVCVKFKTEDEKTRIINYCDDNKLEFVVCPKDIRVNTDAVSIEIKRL